MSAPPDLARLRTTLGDPRLARLLALLRRRIELGETLTGVVTLTQAGTEERTAVDGLLGRRPSRGGTLAIDVDRLEGVLREAGVCENLRMGVEALIGPVADRRALERERDAAWAQMWREAGDALSAQPILGEWLGELIRNGTVKRICGDDLPAARAALQAVAGVVRALPARAEPLASFAARLFGDAHALDPGKPVATLAVRAAARLGGVPFEDDAEGRRAAWAAAGVMCDELSTPVLVYNLAPRGDTPLARLLRSAQLDAEPVHVSLRLLLRWPLGAESGLAGECVSVCENPTVIALAAARLGPACAPLVCVNGQFATPALMLLRQLRGAGARLRYHGDFDPAGLAIARRAFAEGAAPWRFGADDYATAPKGVRFAGAVGPTAWDDRLQEMMRADGRVVHEEAVFDCLAGDLRR